MGIIRVDCSTCSHNNVCSLKKDFVKKADLLLAGQELPAFMLITINCLEYSKVIATGQFRKAAFDGVGNITDGRCTFDE